MRRINSHSSCVIVEAEKTAEFLLSRYDETYPIGYFRGSVNLIGGNYKKEDKSPLGILLREINEELSSNQSYINQREMGLKNLIKGWKPPKKIKLFASEEDISLIRDEIVSCIEPYKDYLWNFPFIEDKIAFNSLSSVFISKINQDVFELARRNLNGGKNIKNEGIARIYSLDDLKEGRIQCAWAAPCILSDYKGVAIPNPYNVKIKDKGKPRSSIQDYMNEFEYKVLI